VILVDSAAVLSTDANEVYLARKYGMPVTMSISADSTVPEDTLSVPDVLAGNGFQHVSVDTTVGNAVIVHEQSTVSNGFRWVNSAYEDIRIVDMVAGEWPVDTADSETLHAVV